MARLELSETEQETLFKWKNAIKEIYGKEGKHHFIVYTTGIGTKVEVYSELADTLKDITDYGEW